MGKGRLVLDSGAPDCRVVLAACTCVGAECGQVHEADLALAAVWVLNAARGRHALARADKHTYQNIADSEVLNVVTWLHTQVC